MKRQRLEEEDLSEEERPIETFEEEQEMGFMTPEKVKKRAKVYSPEEYWKNTMKSLGAKEIDVEDFPYYFHIFESETLGKGSQGEVFEGLEYLDKRKVAIKKTELTGFYQDLILKYSIQEIQNFKKLGCNEYVVCFYDAILVKNRDIPTVYFLMEFIKGATMNYKVLALRQHIKLNKRQKLNIIIKWWNQLLKALQFIHSKNIYHRDIKLDNVMIVDETNLPKLIDFGLSCIKGKCEDSAMGNAFYKDPYLFAVENPKNSNEIGDKSDIWSMGILMYETLNKVFLPENYFNLTPMGHTVWDLYGYQKHWDLKQTKELSSSVKLARKLGTEWKNIISELPGGPTFYVGFRDLFTNDKPSQKLMNELLNQIEWCLRWKPEDRPTASQLLKKMG